MRMAMRSMAVVAAVVMLLGLVNGADGKRTLKGSFEWTTAGQKGDLEAVFTPTGEGKWDVAFHFDFRGPHVYAGTAEGSLSGGELKGRVQNDDKNRSFTFSGSFVDGEFHGTHAEVGDDGEQATGTLTLKG
jgi:glucose/arabinose dehydrogenase